MPDKLKLKLGDISYFFSRFFYISYKVTVKRSADGAVKVLIAERPPFSSVGVLVTEVGKKINESVDAWSVIDISRIK